MSFEIRWTEDAIQDYKEILSYLESNWGKSSAYKFQMKIEKEVGLISKMPGIFPFVNIFKKIRKCVVVK